MINIYVTNKSLYVLYLFVMLFCQLKPYARTWLEISLKQIRNNSIHRLLLNNATQGVEQAIQKHLNGY